MRRVQYTADRFSPDFLDWTSRIGSSGASSAGGRIKPDLVAAGVGVVAGRSDGDPESGGTFGCRSEHPTGLDPLILVGTGIHVQIISYLNHKATSSFMNGSILKYPTVIVVNYTSACEAHTYDTLLVRLA